MLLQSLKKYNWLISLIIALLSLIAQVVGLPQPKDVDFSFITKPIISLSILQVFIILLFVNTLWQFSRWFPNRKWSTKKARRWERRLDELLTQWHDLLNSIDEIDIETNDQSVGMNTLFHQRPDIRYGVDSNGQFAMTFQKLKDKTDYELDSLTKGFPNIRDFAEKVKAEYLPARYNFRSKDEIIHTSRGVLLTIVSIIENTKDALSNK